MPNYSKKDIMKFQRLYLHHYGKVLTMEESEKRFRALVRLLRLVRDVPTKKKPLKMPDSKDNECKKPLVKDKNIPNANLSEPK